MKKLFTLILVALLPMVANAYDAEINGIFYDFSENTATVTYGDQLYNHYSGVVIIPDSVTCNSKTYNVTSIGRKAFYACTNLTLITIPNSVTTIGSSAFEWCTSLTSLYCLAEIVPETNSSTFNNTPIENVTLHVPASALDVYKTTEPWSKFGTIVAFTECYGDLNGDYKVDIADAITVLNIMATVEYSEAADVNNDQKVDIADFVTILNIMAQKIVSRRFVTEIVLSETSITLQPDEIKTLTAMVLPVDADNKELTWESSDSDVAEVNDRGRVIANANGTCVIICRATDGSGVKAECKIIVDAHEYVDLGLPSGTQWATCNIGANSPEEYGDYFAWGETTGINGGKTNFDWSTYKYCMGVENTLTKYCTNSNYGMYDNKTELELEDDAATVNWGSGWQMPSDSQCKELINSEYTTTEWTTMNGKKGRKITSKINGKSIFMPAAGARDSTRFNATDIGAYYWSRSLCTSNNSDASVLQFYSGGIFMTHWWRAYGRSVRPVRIQNIPSIKFVTEIVLSETTVSLQPNGMKILTAIVLPEDADNREVTWSSSDTSIATVDQEGKVTGVSLGSCAITATAKDGSGVKGTCAVTVDREWVDLGLPSGTLWATCNVGASSPEECGDYFAWGETEPKNTYNWSTYKFCNGTEKTFNKYCALSDLGYNGFTDDLTELEPEDDAATANWNSDWQMPSAAQCEELKNYTTTEWTIVNGMGGRKITSIFNSKSIFLPAAGNHWNDELRSVGWWGGYWSRSLYPQYSHSACTIYFASGVDLGCHYHDDRYVGFSVRPVRVHNTPQVKYVTSIILNEISISLQVNESKTITATVQPTDATNKNVTWESSNEAVATVSNEGIITAVAEGTCTITCSTTDGSDVKAECQVTVIDNTHGITDGYEWVDLDLPSGTLWATCNVGASSPEAYGNIYAWGEIATKSNFSWNTYLYCKGSYDNMTKYCAQGNNGYSGFTDTLTELLPSDDVATASWGINWQMPSVAQCRELNNNSYTTTEWTTINGVNGRKITSKGNSKSIFLPAAGYRYDSSLNYAGSSGYYWSHSLDTGNSGSAFDLCFDSSSIHTGSYSRCFGLSVRPVRKQ